MGSVVKGKPPTIYEHEGEPIVKCSACGKAMFYKLLPSGSRMPVSVDSGTSHFIDCPQANRFRRRGKNSPPAKGGGSTGLNR